MPINEDFEAGGDPAVTLALSAEQFAAVLEAESLVPGGTVGNRLIGGLRLLGCAAEVGVAGVLAAAPDPTLLTKAASLGLAGHAADQCTTGARQVWTGLNERSLTERSASGLALGLGASPRTSAAIGMTADFAVPVGGAALAGAARVASVQAGRFSLRRHEARLWAQRGPGGHTIRLHVGQSEGALRARIAETAGPSGRPRLVSSFGTFEMAETQISRVLQLNRSVIQSWSSGARQGVTRAFEMDAGREIGHGVIRASGEYVSMSWLRVVVRKGTYRGMPHYIVSAYPIPRP